VDVGYAPTTDPVPDDGPAADSQRRTYADEEESSSAGGVEEPPMTPPGDDDFGPAERGSEASDGADTTEGTEADGTDPFPEFERPVLPMEDGDDEDADPQPLEELDDEGITLRVSPTRHRVRAEARYRVPRMVRLEVTPESPWQPASGSPAQIASK